MLISMPLSKYFPYDDQTVYEGRTPLMWRLSQKHADTAKILIKNSADVNAGTSTARLRCLSPRP
ncbi:MAG: hypothetical protein R2875_11590 [Desulfobacterales bacterium]